MSAEVKILIEGCTNANETGNEVQEMTMPTVTLIRDEDLIMVVDPGILESQQILIDALERENLTVEDINVVCITHSHIDHYRNIGMFPNAKTLEGYGLWHENTVEDWSEDFSANIQVLHTPGHDHTGITLFVTTDNGIIAICGDVFWKENYPKDPYNDTFASNPPILKESRAMVIKMADWIIPGHGPMYKNDRNAVEVEEEIADSLGITDNLKIKEIKIVIKCKKCGNPMSQQDKCQCRPYFCFRCCECGLDCSTCSCSHKR